MASTKRQFNKGYILLESLLALGLLMTISLFMLSETSNSQKRSQLMNQQIETLNVAKMLLDANLPYLSVNGVSVNLTQNDQYLLVTDDTGKEELRLEILEIQK